MLQKITKKNTGNFTRQNLKLFYWPFEHIHTIRKTWAGIVDNFALGPVFLQPRINCNEIFFT